MDELLPISYINQYAYCPRRFWYMYVEAEMIENVHVLRGVVNHEHVNEPGYATTATGVVAHRRVHVYSHALGITGICDLVEEDAQGVLAPVEYKQGQLGKWSNDQAQLCAQALCLEEMTGRVIPSGAIFYFGSRRREPVLFTAELRGATESIIAAMRRVVALGVIPAHTEQRARCRGCSLYDVCLPTETDLLIAEGGVTVTHHRKQ
ncbi:MAG: CRISPR-associated protein Cas4 [Anaerolineales bacterium]|nr:CRISPR-associated protein Cas4 [Anaerolineales bacterium]